LLATAGLDGTVRLWDPATNKPSAPGIYSNTSVQADLARERGEGQQVAAGLVEVVAAAGNFSAIAATTRSNWALTASTSGWSKTVRTRVATHGCVVLGTFDSRFRR
jgi:hypothetical protein